MLCAITAHNWVRMLPVEAVARTGVLGGIIIFFSRADGSVGGYGEYTPIYGGVY